MKLKISSLRQLYTRNMTELRAERGFQVTKIRDRPGISSVGGTETWQKLSRVVNGADEF